MYGKMKKKRKPASMTKAKMMKKGGVEAMKKKAAAKKKGLTGKQKSLPKALQAKIMKAKKKKK
jgi:hypothetical protein